MLDSCRKRWPNSWTSSTKLIIIFTSFVEKVVARTEIEAMINSVVVLLTDKEIIHAITTSMSHERALLISMETYRGTILDIDQDSTIVATQEMTIAAGLTHVTIARLTQITVRLIAPIIETRTDATTPELIRAIDNYPVLETEKEITRSIIRKRESSLTSPVS
jgi:hypothetical protein